MGWGGDFEFYRFSCFVLSKQNVKERERNVKERERIIVKHGAIKFLLRLNYWDTCLISNDICEVSFSVRNVKSP